MKRIVVDASVAIKWLVPHKPEEADIGKALALFGQFACQERLMLQPPHFIPEVMAVITRLEPDYADRLFIAVSNLEMTIENNATIYQTAIRLSIELNHHLFDTLYHAVALHTPSATFITADEAYWCKAQNIGANCTITGLCRMNKAQLKAYAPQARKDFIAAVTARAQRIGLAEHNGAVVIAPAEKSGDFVIIAGQSWPAKISHQRVLGSDSWR